MRLTLISQHVAEYQQAKRLLAANFTNVQERKSAIDIRDEFKMMAPAFVKELLDGISELVAYTDGEECADPENCNSAYLHSMCSRCRLRELEAIHD